MFPRINDQARLQNLKNGEIRLAMINLNAIMTANGKHAIRCKAFMGQITPEAFALETLRKRWTPSRKDNQKPMLCKKLPLAP
jgi:hypothetical protein